MHAPEFRRYPLPDYDGPTRLVRVAINLSDRMARARLLSLEAWIVYGSSSLRVWSAGVSRGAGCLQSTVLLTGETARRAVRTDLNFYLAGISKISLCCYCRLQLLTSVYSCCHIGRTWPRGEAIWTLAFPAIAGSSTFVRNRNGTARSRPHGAGGSSEAARNQ